MSISEEETWDAHKLQVSTSPPVLFPDCTLSARSIVLLAQQANVAVFGCEQLAVPALHVMREEAPCRGHLERSSELSEECI